MKFQWDSKKEKLNIKKHGISFEVVCYVFSDPYSLSMFDDEHSEDEDRWLILGKSLNDTLLLVVHTFRNLDGKEVVRIVSARRASKNERKIYEKRCLK